jgi:pilus assembly protein Flp/PilA
MLSYLRIALQGSLAAMEERGASAVEYGLLIAGIAAVIVAVVIVFGGKIKNVFQNTCDQINNNATCS